MVDHAFDFFAQLLKNMMRKFMHLQDMVAAKLVTSIAENITRYATCMYFKRLSFFLFFFVINSLSVKLTSWQTGFR